jgi:hypothetical protein
MKGEIEPPHSVAFLRRTLNEVRGEPLIRGAGI